MRGLLIAFEGIDGSGKTLIADMARKRLEDEGYRVLLSYEPRFPEFKELISRIPLSLEDAPFIEALLFSADRLLHYRKVVGPALEEGMIVLLDRYYYSTIAYQGSRGVPEEWIRELNRFVPRPDLAIYLDVTPEIGLTRKTGESWRRFERLEMLRRVREKYLELVERGELVLVDASRNPVDVLGEVMAHILGLLA